MCIHLEKIVAMVSPREAMFEGYSSCWRLHLKTMRSGLFDSGVENDELSAVAKIPIGLMLLLSSYTSEFHLLKIVLVFIIFCNNLLGRVLLQETRRKVKLLLTK